MENQESTESKTSIGPIVGTVIIIIVLAIGGLYVWGAKVKDSQNKQEKQDEVETIETDAAVIDLNFDIDSIEYNLDAE